VPQELSKPAQNAVGGGAMTSKKKQKAGPAGVTPPKRAASAAQASSGGRPSQKVKVAAAKKAKSEKRAVFIKPPPKTLSREMLDIRERLVRLLKQMRGDIDREVRGASERDLAHINDSSDMASDAAEGDLALRIAESETVQASEIERAIEKVDTGTYGLCEVCNKPINAERLQFLPYVTQCIKCQSLSELRKRDKRDELDDLNAEGGDMDAENN
jgi:DnaK suppressor protein